MSCHCRRFIITQVQCYCKGNTLLMHHQMAFDSTRLARKAPNRAPRTARSRFNKRRANTGSEAHQTHTERKEHSQHRQQKTPQSESVSAAAGVCVCVDLQCCSVQRGGGSQTSLPQRSPVGPGSRNKLIGLTALSSSCSRIL